MNLTILPNQKQIGQLQAHLDLVGKDINSILAPAVKFHEWLEAPIKTNHSLKTCIISIVKLPLKAVRNLALAAYQIVQLALSLLVHPVITSKELMNSLKMRAKQLLLDPQAWITTSAAIIGSLVGQSLLGLPLSLAAGLTAEILIGAVIIAYETKCLILGPKKFEPIIIKDIIDCGTNFLEAFTTGLLGGVIFNKVSGLLRNGWLTAFPPQVGSFALHTPDQPKKGWFSR